MEVDEFEKRTKENVLLIDLRQLLNFQLHGENLGIGADVGDVHLFAGALLAIGGKAGLEDVGDKGMERVLVGAVEMLDLCVDLFELRHELLIN